MKRLFLFLPLFAMAAPQGLQVISGNAEVVGAEVRVAEPSVLHWDSYSIAAHEHTHYPSPHATLNRVVGSDISKIDGRLSSNGPLWLINPNGIVIGESGRINAASFLASTLDQVDNLFTGTRGRIEQRGVIECPGGYCVLMAAEGVVQEGTIRAEKVAIGAGQEILFSTEEFRVNSSFAKAAIQCKGLIEAKRLEERGGEVYLVADGLCKVENAEITAEVVHVLGERVQVLGKTVIDTDAGTILIGGDYRGSNPEVKNAKRTFVGEEVLLKADAREKGDGGKVIVWADEATQFSGRISARGGNSGGSGGQAEVSGKFLQYKGSADLRAPQGKFGTLLLDPDDVVISGDVTTVGVDLTTNPATLPDAVTVTINATDLTNQLQISNVTIDNTLTMGGGSGSISITSPIGDAATWDLNTTLTLVAYRNIGIASSITNVNDMDDFIAMDFTANGTPSGTYVGIEVSNVAVTAMRGEIRMTANGGTGDSSDAIRVTGASGRIATTSGAITLAGAAIGRFGNGFVAESSGFVESDSGLISITGSAAEIITGSFGISIGTTNGLRSTSGNIQLTGTSAMSFGVGAIPTTSFVTTSGTITLINCEGGTMSSGPSSSNGCNVRFVTPGSVVFSNCQGHRKGVNMVGDCSADGSITFEHCFGGASTIADNSGVSLISTGTLSVGGSMIFSDCIGGSGGGRGVYLEGSVSVGGDITATEIEGVLFQGFRSDSTVSAGGNITISAFVTTGGSSAHGIQIANTMSTTSGDITLLGRTAGPTSSNGVSLTGAVTSTSGTISIAGSAELGCTTGCQGVSLGSAVTTGGDIKISGTNAATGSSSHGVTWTVPWTTGSTGTVTFGDQIMVGMEMIEGCQGGSGSTSHGINATQSLTTSGNIVATNTILSGTGTGSHGLNGTANITAGGNIEILATSQAGSSTASHGINYTGGSTTMSSPGDITLIGIGPTGNSGSCHGVNLTGIVTTSGAGTIKIGGNARGTGTGVGVLVSSSTNRITSSGGGAIQVSGVSTATGSSSHGISWTSSWTTSTAGAVTFGAPITIDATTIEGCQGGTGGSSHGINAGSTFTTSGSVTATNFIIGGTGTGSHGFSSGSTFNASGNPIAITASTTAGGSTASHGINYTSGTMSGSLITLNGTTSSSNTGASNGINLAGGALSSSSGTVSLTGTAVATAGGSSRGILLSSSNPITSSGNSIISLDGTSHATGSSCHGVSITSSAWVTGSTANLDITGVADGGGATTFPINLGGSTTHSGNIDFNSAVGLSANTSVIGNGDATKTILFMDTVNGTAAGSQSLTLTTGAVNVGGSVSINGNVGFATNGRLNLFTMTGGNLLLNANIKAFQGTINAPITVSGDFDLTATAID